VAEPNAVAGAVSSWDMLGALCHRKAAVCICLNERPLSGNCRPKLDDRNVGDNGSWFQSAQFISRPVRNHILQTCPRPISILGEVPWDTQTLILPFINGGPGMLA
jgi:hypothetical protein